MTPRNSAVEAMERWTRKRRQRLPGVTPGMSRCLSGTNRKAFLPSHFSSNGRGQDAILTSFKQIRHVPRALAKTYPGLP
jgi:hypothetical protein